MYNSIACQFAHGWGEGSCQVSIYLDDVLTYTSPMISAIMEPIYAKIDVTGINLIRLEVVSPDLVGTEVGQLIIDTAVS